MRAPNPAPTTLAVGRIHCKRPRPLVDQRRLQHSKGHPTFHVSQAGRRQVGRCSRRWPRRRAVPGESQDAGRRSPPHHPAAGSLSFPLHSMRSAGRSRRCAAGRALDPPRPAGVKRTGSSLPRARRSGPAQVVGSGVQIRRGQVCAGCRALRRRLQDRRGRRCRVIEARNLQQRLGLLRNPVVGGSRKLRRRVLLRRRGRSQDGDDGRRRLRILTRRNEPRDDQCECRGMQTGYGSHCGGLARHAVELRSSHRAPPRGFHAL
jgi:hypothetical protein